MRKHLITLGVGVALAAGLALPSAAGAATTSTDKGAASTATSGTATRSSASALTACPSGYFCVWYLRSYGGARYQWYGNDSNWTNNYFYAGIDVNDDDASWYNHGTACYHCDKVAVYRDINYGGGATIYLARGQYVAVSSAENRGSSHRWY